MLNIGGILSYFGNLIAEKNGRGAIILWINIVRLLQKDPRAVHYLRRGKNWPASPHWCSEALKPPLQRQAAQKNLDDKNKGTREIPEHPGDNKRIGPLVGRELGWTNFLPDEFASEFP